MDNMFQILFDAFREDANSSSSSSTNLTLPAYNDGYVFLSNTTQPLSFDGNAPKVGFRSNTFMGSQVANFTMGTPFNPLLTFAGTNNTIIGAMAYQNNTTGYNNVGVGVRTLRLNTTGQSNVAVGYEAMRDNTTGMSNVALGAAALESNTIGQDNMAMGSAALFANTTGSANLAIGRLAGYTEVGANANVSGGFNVWLGYQAGPGVATQLTNSIGIGYQSHPTLSNQAVFGSSTITKTQLYGDVTFTSLLPGGDFIIKQNGVNVFTSYETGAVVDTLVLKTGQVGVGATPTTTFQVTNANGSLFIGNNSFGSDWVVLTTDPGFAVAKYAMAISQAASSTLFNVPSGGTFSLRAANSPMAAFSATTASISGSFQVGSIGTPVAKFQVIDGGCNFIASNNSFGGDFCVLTDDTGLGAGNYFLLASASNGTFLNARSGKSILFRVANSTMASVSSTGVNVTDTLSYRYNGVRIADAQTTLNNFYFGDAGNLTATGTNNTAGGFEALKALTTGQDNTAFGEVALTANADGTDNTAFGIATLKACTSGGSNVAVGNSALFTSTTASNNTAVGSQCFKTTTVSDQTGLGYLAGTHTTTGSDNTAIGFQALNVNTTGNNNTAVGSNAMFGGATGTGNYNTAMGSLSMQAHTSGAENAHYGGLAGYSLTTGSNNTGIGMYALTFNVTGSGNIALGHMAGRYETGSDKFYVDNQDNTNTAGDVAHSIIYGTMNATATSQHLRFNVGDLAVGTKVGATTTSYSSVAEVTGGLVTSATAFGSGRSAAQTAAVASVATFSNPATDHSYEVSANVLVTTATTHAFNVECAYTDEGNTARVAVLPFRLVGDTTALTSSVANGNGAVPYNGVPIHIRVKASTTITVRTQAAGDYTTVTYNVEGIIKQVA